MEYEHPIESLMRTTLDSIKNMVDVNTILGDPVETPDGKVIVPISRVTFGFAAGGTEYEPSGQETGGGGRQGSDGGGGMGQGAKTQGAGPPANQPEGRPLPFGGGSGAGISIQPVGFLVVGREEMRLLPVDGQVLYDRLLDLAPKLLDGLQGLAQRRGAGGRALGGYPGPAAGESPTTGQPGPTEPPYGRGKPLIRLRGRGRADLS